MWVVDLNESKPEDNLWKLSCLNYNNNNNNNNNNNKTVIVRLTGDSYRTRWWLVLNFETLDSVNTYSIVISRFTYPKAMYQKLSASLWCYV